MSIELIAVLASFAGLFLMMWQMNHQINSRFDNLKNDMDDKFDKLDAKIDKINSDLSARIDKLYDIIGDLYRDLFKRKAA